MQMLIEVNLLEQIVHLVISDEIYDTRQQCWISYLDRAA